MRTAPPSHWVGHNKVTRVPRNFIYFDSEAKREPIQNGEMQTLRLAVAAHDRRRHDNGAFSEREYGDFRTGAGLWKWVDARTQARARTVCVAHNLAYDLRITSALSELPGLGWELRAIRIDRGSAWCSWRRGDRSLVMADTYAWVPAPLERLGELVEIPKLDLPDWDDDDEAWLARCVRDVQITAEVWRRLMGWVTGDDLGNWKPTGAGQAWAAYRHRFMEHRLLAHDDEAAREAERRAAWTGRCEVWRHGRARGGPFSEWDYSAAYAHIGAECKVPIKLAGQTTGATFDQWEKLTKRYAVLARCTVTTDVPTVPTEVDGRICWPVGTFDTTLWENEVRHALDNGATVTITDLWWYRRAPALAGFCRWVLEHNDETWRGLDPVIVLAAKHWGRALIGRFGARWSSWDAIGRAPEMGLNLSTVIDNVRGERYAMLQVGHELRRKSAEVDSPDAVVAVMSWVMAECRVRLWRVMECAGFDNVCYVDTDGVIVTEAGTQRLRAADVEGLRCKAVYPTATFHGPRQIELGGALRAAGIPRGARSTGGGTYAGEVWDTIGTSLRNGTADSVSITTRSVRLLGSDTRRAHVSGGATLPRSLGGEP